MKKRMKEELKQLLKEEGGQSLSEYALVLAIIVIASWKWKTGRELIL
jgi:hypothetical protein